MAIFIRIDGVDPVPCGSADSRAAHVPVTILRHASCARLRLALPARHPPPLRRHAPLEPAPGDGAHKEPRRDQREQQEDHAPEGYRQSACGRLTVAYSQRRRQGLPEAREGLDTWSEPQGLGARSQDGTERALAERRGTFHAHSLLLTYTSEPDRTCFPCFCSSLSSRHRQSWQRYPHAHSANPCAPRHSPSVHRHTRHSSSCRI